MDTRKILAELKRIRAASHARPIQATENDLSRLIAALEREEGELEKEWNSLLRGEKLVNVDLDITYQLVRD